MAIEKLKINKTHILKTIKAINSDIRPQTQHKNPEHIYLKFLTPLTLMFIGPCIIAVVDE